MKMKCDISRQRIDPVLAPDQFGVARPLGPEDLDRHVTRHGIYPSFLAPTGVPWSEYLSCRGIGQGQSHPLLRPWTQIMLDISLIE